MTKIEFNPWPKTPRLFRDVTITEKIDGTNAAVGIAHLSEFDRIETEGEAPRLFDNDAMRMTAWAAIDGETYVLWAQSRKRLVTPSSPANKNSDNHGFAGWVRDNAPLLVLDLGVGLHYGEWWGSGVERGYGLANGDKRFSLFNTARYGSTTVATPGVGVVPVLYEGPYTLDTVEDALLELQVRGSRAVPGFMRPEGVCVYHQAAGQVFKVLIENDDKPKGLAA